MDVTGPGKSGKRNQKETLDKSEVSSGPHSTDPRPDAAAAETQINLVSPFAHPRGAKVARSALRDFVASHPIPVALSCLALGGTIAAIIYQRQRRDTWDARLGRLRQSLVNVANEAG
jgi:hypothetical protein